MENDSFESFKPKKFFGVADVETGPIVLTIASIGKEEVGEKKDKLAVLRFENEERGMILKTENLDLLKEVYPTPSKAMGQPIELFKSKTKFGGKTVPCLRLRAPTGEKTPF